ncbi:MAG: hypothetical protein IJ196_06260 [Prevotella sp.]|nr:hypothetical protein [Prevotella sp.]
MKRLFAALSLLFVLAGTAFADNWMAELDDYAYISQVSIPGTHDSCTGEGWSGILGSIAGNSTGLTQDLSIAQQLQAGIRAFDLRPCVNGSQLVINHGILQTKAVFNETLRQLCQFVSDNPTEFVVIIMRHESDGDSNNDNWASMMSESLALPDLQPQLADFRPDLTVGDMRGKVLVLSRDSYGETPVGGYITGWSHDANYSTNGRIQGSKDRGTLYVQDFYEVMENTADKTNAIKSLLDFTMRIHRISRYKNYFCINHTSGYTSSASSNGNRNNAAICNATVIEYLDNASHNGPTGIVMTDFAGTDRSGNYNVMGQTLIEKIIAQNSKYEPQKKANPNGIRDINAPTGKEKTFDLGGRPLEGDATTRGIVVKNGKKIINSNGQ